VGGRELGHDLIAREGDARVLVHQLEGEEGQNAALSDKMQLYVVSDKMELYRTKCSYIG
jgi:hypothetical protein